MRKKGRGEKPSKRPCSFLFGYSKPPCALKCTQVHWRALKGTEGHWRVLKCTMSSKVFESSFIILCRVILPTKTVISTIKVIRIMAKRRSQPHRPRPQKIRLRRSRTKKHQVGGSKHDHRRRRRRHRKRNTPNADQVKRAIRRLARI